MMSLSLGASSLGSEAASASLISRRYSIFAALCIVVCLIFLGGKSLRKPDRAKALPQYSVELIDGVGRALCDARLDAVPRLLPGSTLELVLRPAERVDEDFPLHVEAFLRVHGTLRPWPFTFYRARSGALFGQAHIDDLRDVPTGRHELLFKISDAAQPITKQVELARPCPGQAAHGQATCP